MVSVIVATYNRCDFLKDCIKSFEDQSCEKSLFEVLIIDNNSTDNTAQVSQELIAAYPNIDIRYMVESNQGLSYGRNRGIVESKFELIHFFDDDAVATPEYIASIIDIHQRFPKAMASGGKILLNYFEGRPKWVSKYMESIFGLFDIGDEEQEFPRNDYPRGSNMTFRREIFDQVGPFDVNLGRKGKLMLGGEEKEMFKRIYATGASVIYSPQTVSYHAVPEPRTRFDFIQRQVYGIGVSENIRVNTASTQEKIKRYLMEMVKWGATSLLFVKYLFLELNWTKAALIVKFRWWITKGLIVGHQRDRI